MADKHPYVPGAGGLFQAVAQFRKSFPPQVSAETLKKLSIAPNNESYIINTLRYIGLLDKDGKKTTEAGTVFNQHNDEDFQKGFAGLVEAAYADLFELHQDGAWTLEPNKLIGFFRNSDQTSAIVGQRQASAFQALASLSGYAPAPVQKSNGSKVKASKGVPVKNGQAKTEKTSAAKTSGKSGVSGQSNLSLSMRVEINLPIAPDQETYDKIFKSIRENLLNG